MENIHSLLQDSDYTVVFTGAGMSTESGLPDFRSKARGLWTKFNPDQLANVKALQENTDEFIDFYCQRIAAMDKYKPHKGHEILADWEQRGFIQSIITQNVDGFHHEAGSDHVIELHGTLRHSHCHQCKKVYDNERLEKKQLTCACGGIIRPSIVLFGEMLPEEALEKAGQEAEKAELFIVLGSSLSVTPANFFPLKAKEHGAKLVIINMESTELDPVADIVINDKKIKGFLEELDNQLIK